MKKKIVCKQQIARISRHKMHLIHVRQTTFTFVSVCAYAATHKCSVAWLDSLGPHYTQHHTYKPVTRTRALTAAMLHIRNVERVRLHFMASNSDILLFTNRFMIGCLLTAWIWMALLFDCRLIQSHLILFIVHATWINRYKLILAIELAILRILSANMEKMT